ncbi:Aldehyde dehydrogenase [Burkholderia anthina]|nr:Aldehyde dehydrogenase [Burkholderia anthina]
MPHRRPVAAPTLSRRPRAMRRVAPARVFPIPIAPQRLPIADKARDSIDIQ